MFDSAGLMNSRDPGALSLLGRLLKDRALGAEGAERAALFDRSEQAYLEAAGQRPATYPLINAATIALLNGRPARAHQLAQRTLDLLDSGDHEPGTAYWLGATRAEAKLLLGEPLPALALLEQAVAGTPDAWEDHAATIRQLRLVLGQMDLRRNIFDHLLPPPSLHFSGLIHLPCDHARIEEQIGTCLDNIKPGFVFGALAAGTDILIAELALDRGALLHAVLPAPVDLFREVSVAPFGTHWVRRFDRLIEQAEAVETICSGGPLSSGAIQFAEEIAMGWAIRHAHSLATQAQALRVRRTTDELSCAERAWRRRGLPVHDLAVTQAGERGSTPLAAGSKQVIMVADCATPIGNELPFQRAEDGARLLILDDLESAVRAAVSILQGSPDATVGLVYHAICEAGMTPEDLPRIAAYLARSAPEGTICAASPGALAIDLCAPGHRFERAGEMVTPFGDIPINLYSPAAAA